MFKGRNQEYFKRELQIPFTSIGDLWYNYFRQKNSVKTL